MKLLYRQTTAFCNAYTFLEEIELDNARGMAAAELYAVVFNRAQAYQMRQKALQKERQKIIEDHAKKNRKNEKEYANPTEPDPNKRILLWRDGEKATAALEAWAAKAEALDEQVIEFEAVPLPDEFFEKPDELKVKNVIRTGFLPLMKKSQTVHAAPTRSKRK